MDGIRRYLLTVTAAALVCAIVGALFDKKGAPAAVMKLLCGLFMTFCVISPFMDFELMDFSSFTGSFSDDAAAAVSDGKSMASNAQADIIKEQTRTYILDKAQTLDLDIDVEVILDSSDIPAPCAVILRGAVSPYAKEVLGQYIENNLSIPKENQTWS